MLSDTYLTFVNPTTVRKIHQLVTEGEKLALGAEFDHAIGAAGTRTVAQQALAFASFCEAMSLLREICDTLDRQAPAFASFCEAMSLLQEVCDTLDDALGKAGM